MGKRQRILVLTLTLLLSLCLSIGLYHWDNKYTHPAVQPISGVLFPESDSVSFLTREWLFYPDVLLTPQDAASYQGYRQYVDIGGNQPMERGSDTYQLTLMLPDAPGSYALELPEIFSAYQLYINDALIYQMGNPDPSAYQVEIGSKVIPFSASGTTQLLLAVTDYHGIYSGLVYPPAFGSTDHVLALGNLRLLVHCAEVLIALLAVGLSLLFAWKADRKKGVLGACLGLFVIGISGYPLFYGLLQIPFHLTYVVEVFCYYALLTLALFLQCSCCRLSNRLTFGLLFPGLMVCLVALAYCSLPALWPSWGGNFFSILSLCLKYYTAVCLVVLAFYGQSRKVEHFTCFQCGAVLYGVFLFVDRLAPLYEPIVGGWFGELGGVCLALALSVGLWLDTIDAYRFHLSYAENHRRMESRLAMQKEHYLELSQQIKGARQSAHDLRHHMRVLRSMANQSQFPQLVDYLNSYEPHLERVRIQVWSEHPVADSILAHYATITHQLGGTYDAQLTIPPQLSIPDDEFCVILSNLLENATEALQRQTAGSRRIYIRGAIDHQNLGIIVDNTFDGKVRTRDGHFLSRKHHGLGLGLSSVSTIAEGHGGLSDFYEEENIFHASVIIPLPDPVTPT